MLLRILQAVLGSNMPEEAGKEAVEDVPIKIPGELVRIIDHIIEHKKHGYRSREEFINEALREKLKSMGYLQPIF